MLDFHSLTYEDIIGISSAEKLFETTDLKKQLKQLLSIWHPDRCKHPKAADICAHVQQLYEQAETKIANNLWNGPSSITFIADGVTYKFNYRAIKDIDIGQMYIAHAYVMFVIRPEFKPLYDNGIAQIKRIKYPNVKFKEQMERQIPNIVKVANADIGHILIVSKTKDLVLLDDLLNFLPDNKLHPKHVAWIISTLCNQLCLLEYNNVMHGAISPKTVFVTPEYHSGALLGGWWYAREKGSKLLALPRDSVTVLPASILKDKTSKLEFDRMLVKATGLESLGDSTKTGLKLTSDKDIPREVLTWLRSVSAPTAVLEYGNWRTARDTGFKKREFFKFTTDITNIY